MDLEIIIPSEVRERLISYDITYMWDSKKMIQMNLFITQKHTHRLQKQTYGYPNKLVVTKGERCCGGKIN